MIKNEKIQGDNKMKKIFFAALMTSIFFIGCSKEKANVKLNEKKEEAIPVKVSKVRSYTFVDKAKIWGEIKPIKTVGVYSKINGAVKTKNVEEGEFISKGKLIAEVEQDLPGLKYETHKVFAPIDGIILKSNFYQNDRVNNQQPIAIIAPVDSVYFVAKIYENYYEKLNIGQIVEINFPALKGEKYYGKLKEFGTMAEPQTNYIEAKFLTKNNGRKLKFGFVGNAEIILEKRKALAIPIDALIKTGAESYIFKVVDNKTQRVLVETGLIEKNMIEAQGNISESDIIVTYGQNLLSEGNLIKIVGE